MSISAIPDAFSNAIAPALYGNSPQAITSFKGTFFNLITLPPFDLNRNVAQLLINLSLTRKLSNADLFLALQHVRILKDGNDITPYFKTIASVTPADTILLKTILSIVERAKSERFRRRAVTRYN